MPYRNMSLDDFAKYVGMDARDVKRLADRGKLPGQKIGGEWRFNRARVTEWLQQEMHTLGEERLIALERGIRSSSGLSTETDELTVTDMIGLEGIDPSLPARTRASVLREMVSLANRTGLLYDPAGLLTALEQREEMCSTALPNGVALPHPRQPMPYVSAEPLICIGRVPKGIGFGSTSRELTHLFFLICCHHDHHHLRVLARLVRLLAAENVAGLLEVETREEMLQILIEAEKQIVAEK
ncbi:MAG: PTS sugar transporter subunit IIA [Phycisphaerae bacterium]|nr:PTS sugar transporter subunit IIA [Phycisphaerae bacterium]